MKNTFKTSFIFILLMVFLLASCTPADNNVQVETVVPAVQAEGTSPEAVAAPTEVVLTEEAQPTAEESQPAAPTPTPFPVFPNRYSLPYFDMLPDYEDLPEFFQVNFLQIYEAARYEDHYSVRVIYQGNTYPQDQYYLAATVTVAEDGVLQTEQLSENYVNVVPEDFPTIGESSAVLRGTRQFAWVRDGNVYLEVALIGGGDNTFTPELVYELTKKLYERLPETLPPPAEFVLKFPSSECSDENFNRYLQNLEFGNYSIREDHIEAIATDLYWDTWVYYKPTYPVREVMFGIYDKETDQYTYQRYKQSSYEEYREGFRNWMYFQNLYTAFDLMPVTGFYDFRVWIEQSCLFEKPFEIFEREDG